MPHTLLVICGPLAVGKMTVAQEVCRLTGFKLFHNHMTIDSVTPIFEWGSPPAVKLISEFRFRIMEEAAAAGIPGLVHTFVWGYQDGGGDTAFISTLKARVEELGGRVCFVELQAPLALRKERAFSENRKKHKPGNVERAYLLEQMEANHVLDSQGKFPFPEAYLRIDNESVEAASAARRICEEFGIPILPK